MYKLSQDRRGFTLIEIMIVVLIIGILLAIAVPNFITARKTSRTKACVANMKQIESAMEQFAMAKSKAQGDTIAPATDLAPDYIKSVPVCPSTGAAYTGDTTVGGEVTCATHGTVAASKDE
jgi:prepilin-type N-terminal cleavage/methylation domain-containing protein